MAEVKWQARRVSDSVLVDVTADVEAIAQAAPTANAIEVSGGGGGGVTVDNQDDPPVEVTTLIAPGASLSGDEADMSDVVAIRRASVTLTNAQIKALPSTPIDLVSAVADAVLLPISAFLRLEWTASYTNINAGCYISVLPNGSGSILKILDETGAVGARVQDLLGADESRIAVLAADIGTGRDATWVNVPIQITCDNAGAGNFTGGNAANSLVVTVIYTVLSV
jgi:hypothetical protein